MIRQPRHLGEIAHRGFTRVGLPVRIRRKRRRRIQRQVRRTDGSKLLRIERQVALHALDQVEQQHGNEAEQQHGDCILRPGHFVLFIHAGRAVNQLLDRPQHRIQKRFFAVEHARHEHAERLCDGQDQQQEKRDLQPSIDGHLRISPDKVVRRTDTPASARSPPASRLFPCPSPLPDPLTKVNVANRQHEENNRDYARILNPASLLSWLAAMV